MSRAPILTGFLGPGQRRHVFYLVRGAGQSRHVPACGRSTDGVIINHTNPYDARFEYADDSCAACKRMVERVKNGVTPDHLAGMQ